jgi:hypothetical protein
MTLLDRPTDRGEGQPAMSAAPARSAAPATAPAGADSELDDLPF